MTRLDGTPVAASSPRGRHRDDIWTRREGANATVSIVCSRSRYDQGEVVVRTSYRLADGTNDIDRSHRIYLGNPTGGVIEKIWDLLFDETTRAQQFSPDSVSIHLNAKGFPAHWKIRLRTIAQIAACELKVVVKGTAEDSVRGRK